MLDFESKQYVGRFACDDERELVASFAIPDTGISHSFIREIESYLFSPRYSYALSGNSIKFYD